MTKVKDERDDRQTKAGLMDKNAGQSESSGESFVTNEPKETAPKISKEKAEDQGRERPLH